MSHRQMHMKRPRGRAAFYAAMYPCLVAAAKCCGYAMCVHGSMARDFDVVAVPWTDDAREPSVLVERLAKAVGGTVTVGPTAKPHGRVAFVVYFGPGSYLDLSVMPRTNSKEARK